MNDAFLDAQLQLLLVELAALPLYASVRLPALFADHMVISRDEPVHV
jgi:hypothetical protein